MSPGCYDQYNDETLSSTLSAKLPFCRVLKARTVQNVFLFSFQILGPCRPVARKCVGRSDQSATCLCALYLSQCSILVCVCFVLFCIRCHCLYDRNIYVCSVFVSVLNSMYLFAPCVLLGILFIISVSSSSSNALLLVCYLCAWLCNPLFLERVALLLVSSHDMMSHC